ncbi:MAG: nucleotide exchange factor GrpE [Eubacteriales bacterium]|jgi:molecular chaperone GrpE|nr:nucleotide exchange factor GrpE [Eubacteriales bacterium]
MMNKEASQKAAESFEDVAKETKEAAEQACEEKEKVNVEEEKEEIKEEVVESEEKEEPINMQYMRLMADFQNYKKRVEKEKGDIYAYANEKIVTDLLDVIDNFERALAQGSQDESFIEGMEMIFKQYMGVLEKAGLEEIKAFSEDFDPNYHNAVMTEDNSDFESGKITEVLQKGYLLNGKVIRPSMVKVNN